MADAVQVGFDQFVAGCKLYGVTPELLQEELDQLWDELNNTRLDQGSKVEAVAEEESRPVTPADSRLVKAKVVERSGVKRRSMRVSKEVVVSGVDNLTFVEFCKMMAVPETPLQWRVKLTITNMREHSHMLMGAIDQVSLQL
jgi:hypothetical protein